MCLTSESKKPLIAKYDIVCYKMMCNRKWIFGRKWETPVQGMRVRNAVMRGRCLMKARGKRQIFERRINDNFIRYDVYGGYIHTYCGPQHQSVGENMFECVIPKGEEYYKSYDGYEYASRSIRFIKRMF